MPLDFTTLTPREGTGIVRVRRGRTGEPNPFLDEDFGHLGTSYETGQDFEVGPVGGQLVEYTVTKGAHAGELSTKWTGDVVKVVGLIRDAAAELGMGVSMDIVPAVNGRGKELTGQAIVKYLAKERRQYRRNTGTEEE
jgi:hypothetical protein